MGLFLIVLNAPNQDVESRIDGLANGHKHLDNVIVVIDDTTLMELAITVGTKGENRIANAVEFKLSGS